MNPRISGTKQTKYDSYINITVLQKRKFHDNIIIDHGSDFYVLLNPQSSHTLKPAIIWLYRIYIDSSALQEIILWITPKDNSSEIGLAKASCYNTLDANDKYVTNKEDNH